MSECVYIFQRVYSRYLSQTLLCVMYAQCVSKNMHLWICWDYSCVFVWGVFNPCGHEMSENLKRKIVKFDKTSLRGHSCEDKWFNKEQNNVLKKKIV